MPKINFYLLMQDNTDARAALACRLSEQLQKQGLPVAILVQDQAEADEFDQLLWRFNPESFVPHALAGNGHETGVTVCWPTHSPSSGNLLNLVDDLPHHHETLDSIAEFVLNNDAAKARSRERWNSYKKLGYELQHHQIK